MTHLKRLYGLIGYPVRHSLSPLMHNAAFKALNISAEYRLFEVKPEELEGFLKSLKEKNIYGLNVTVPYKEKVIPFLDSLSKEAELIGAVNTIKRQDNKLEGFNTDGEGFLRHLREDIGYEIEDAVVALIGAGGAARAISVYLSKANPHSITILDIDKKKAEGLASNLKRHFNHIKFLQVNSVTGLNIENADLLINATPIGMKKNDPCLVDKDSIRKHLLVYDLIYNPAETKLLKIAKERGARISNGLGMLLYQGALSFEFWTGQKAPVEIMRQALTEGIKKL